MTIVVGCDNAAVDLKNTLIACLKEQGVTVEHEGCMDASDPTVYPLVAKRVCENIIRSGYAKRGVLVCGTGIGMCITANKFPGIRATTVSPPSGPSSPTTAMSSASAPGSLGRSWPRRSSGSGSPWSFRTAPPPPRYRPSSTSSART